MDLPRKHTYGNKTMESLSSRKFDSCNYFWYIVLSLLNEIKSAIPPPSNGAVVFILSNRSDLDENSDPDDPNEST